MAVVGPGLKPQVRDELVLNIDLTAMIYQLAGLEVPSSLHGRSVLPIVQGETPSDWRTSFLYEAPTPQLGSKPLWAVRDARWKYIETELGNGQVFRELYDLNSDAIETKNLADESSHADLIAEFSQQLKAYLKGLAHSN